MTPPYVVFDCMIFLQAAGSGKGPAFALLELFEAGAVRLLFSPALDAEVQEVLSRPELRRKMIRLTPERVAAFRERIRRHAV